jgi:hypothetical protein
MRVLCRLSQERVPQGVQPSIRMRFYLSTHTLALVFQNPRRQALVGLTGRSSDAGSVIT